MTKHDLSELVSFVGILTLITYLYLQVVSVFSSFACSFVIPVIISTAFSVLPCQFGLLILVCRLWKPTLILCFYTTLILPFHIYNNILCLQSIIYICWHINFLNEFIFIFSLNYISNWNDSDLKCSNFINLRGGIKWKNIRGREEREGWKFSEGSAAIQLGSEVPA